MEERKVNGVDVVQLGRILREYGGNEELGRYQFRSRTRWLGGGHTQTTITDYYGGGEENDGRNFTLEADEPRPLLGGDKAPNPVEHLLHALATCLTSSMIYHAAAHGIHVEACECEVTGELDLRGFLDVAPNVRPGYRHIDVRFFVRTDATAGKLEALARFSPVLDVLMHGTEVAIAVETAPAEIPLLPA